MSMNKCIFIGNLGKDPEIRYTSSQMPVANISLGLSRGRDKEGTDKGTDWIRCTAFGKTAEVMQKHLRKGDKVALECRVQTGSYEKNGQKVYTTDFMVDRLEFMGGGQNRSVHAAGAQYQRPPQQAQGQPINTPTGFTEISGDEIPFY